MSPTSTQADPTKTRELTGRHVLFMVVGFFGLLIVVNALFITLAVRSHSGEDIEKSYRQGIDYNQTLAARAAQDALGWRAGVNVTDDGEIVLRVTDADGRVLSGLSGQGRLRHPTDRALDRPLDFSGTQTLRAAVGGGPLIGRYRLEATVMRGEDSFALQRELTF